MANPYPINTRSPERLLTLSGGVSPLVRVPQLLKGAQQAGGVIAGDALKLSAGAAQAAETAVTVGQVGLGTKLAALLKPASLLRTTGIGALISFPLAALQNFLDLRAGNKTTKQFMAGTLADGAAYTAAGTVGSVVGALVGSVVPVAGTAIGMIAGSAVGIGLGWIYDKVFRQKAGQAVEAKLFS